jgi:hypothetical protein
MLAACCTDAIEVDGIVMHRCGFLRKDCDSGPSSTSHPLRRSPDVSQEAVGLRSRESAAHERPIGPLQMAAHTRFR